MLLAPLMLLLVAQAPSALREEPDIVYHTIGARELRLDAYLPARSGAGAGVLVIHGGAWQHGTRKDVAPLARALARAGYAAFAPEYRLAPADAFPAQLEDCRSALEFLRASAERFALDPERLGALGLSAGGHLALLLGVRSDAGASARPRCVVSEFGPTAIEQAASALFGDAREPDLASASPLRWVSADDPPVLLVHGDADPLVPLEHSQRMAAALHAAAVPCELVVVPGGGHGDFLRSDPEGEHWRATLSFLGRWLAADER